MVAKDFVQTKVKRLSSELCSGVVALAYSEQKNNIISRNCTTIEPEIRKTMFVVHQGARQLLQILPRRVEQL